MSEGSNAEERYAAIETHDRLTLELRHSVGASHELDYDAPVYELAERIARLVRHDATYLPARDFRRLYGDLEKDLRRAVRKWKREHDVQEDHTEPSRYNMTAAEATDLYDLRCRFGDRYTVSYTAGKRWRAWRIGDALWRTLEADNAGDLRVKLRDDLAEWDRQIREDKANG